MSECNRLLGVLMFEYTLHVFHLGESWTKKHQTKVMPAVGDHILFASQGRHGDALQLTVTKRWFQAEASVSLYTEIYDLCPESQEAMVGLGFDRD